MGLGSSNVTSPSAMQNQAAVSPQLNSMMQPLGFDPYPEVPSYGGTRLRGVYTHVPGGPPVPVRGILISDILATPHGTILRLRMDR